MYLRYYQTVVCLDNLAVNHRFDIICSLYIAVISIYIYIHDKLITICNGWQTAKSM